MNCPRCGQQQVSEEIKFCSRCGFSLVLVSELLANNGYLPQLAAVQKQGKLPSRKTGVKIGAVWFLVITLLLTPLFAIIEAEALAAITAVLGTIGGILIMLFSWMFLEKEVRIFNPAITANENYAAQQFVGGQNRQTALPPQQSQPVESYIPPAESWRAPNTGEFTRPGSVTEGTTKLLKNDEQ